jgi:SAM-dependent methyltransferase
MTTLLDKLLSEETRWRIQFARLAFRRARRIEIRARDCNICGFTGYFLPMGRVIRPEAKCPNCGSAERHRLFKLWLGQNPSALKGRKTLHFAAETCITRFVKPLVSEYVTADIEPGRDLVLNIENIALPNSSFDAIICFHVLEHVDDRKALAELRRILRPDGFLFLMFPVAAGWAKTYEDSAITDPKDREVYFGQANHVRIFGADAEDRIASTGFVLTQFTATGPDSVTFSISPGEKLFIARRSG